MGSGEKAEGQPELVRVRIRRKTRRRWQQRRRRMLLVGGGLLSVAAIIALVGSRDVLSARRHLTSARATLALAVSQPAGVETAAGRADTAQALDAAIDQVSAAGRIVRTSLPLRLIRPLPLVGSQRSGLVQLVADSRSALAAGRALLDHVAILANQGKVTAAQVPLATVAAFEAHVRETGSTLAALSRPGAGLWGPLGQARRDLNRLVGSTGSRLLGDADSLEVARRLMGGVGSRRYLVALENNAEMRDQGTVLSYAVVTFDLGLVHVTEHGSILTPTRAAAPGITGSLALESPAPIPVPPGTATVFGSILPTQLWQSVNATADFAWSGRAMQAMYHQASNQTVDGIIALDVPALSSLLSVVGPLSLPGLPQPITAANASTLLLHDLYALFPPNQQGARYEVLSEVVSEAVNRLQTSTFDPIPLARRLATSALGGHLRLWSADAGEENVIEHDALGGGPGLVLANRTFHVSIENRTATKLDYYVMPTVKQNVTITRAGAAIISTTVMVHNTAPVGAKPSYALGPDGYGTKLPGEYGAWILMWGPASSNQRGSVFESGLNLSQNNIQPIEAGETKQVTFVTVIQHAVEKGAFRLRYVPQPRLVPSTLQVTIAADGWHIGGSPSFNGPWDRTVTLNWSLRR